MAVSVRAACSMPHLHSLDFDLSPKGHYSRDLRWGNSSPVLILSLLEIVEQDSIHMQEAAPRLKPGWVRNACAAFEQGIPFSNVEDLGKLQSSENCQPTVKTVLSEVKQVTPSPSSSREEPPTKARLLKAKSLDSLHSHKPFPKKHRVPTPRELRRNASFSQSSTAARKEVSQQFQKRVNSQDGQSHGLSKPERHCHDSRDSHTSRVKTSLTATSDCTTNSKQGDLSVKDCLYQNDSSRFCEVPSSELISEDAQAISVASIELGKSIAPMVSMQGSPSEELELYLNPVSVEETINSPSDGSIVKMPSSYISDIDNLHGLPTDSEGELVQEVITDSSNTKKCLIPGASSATSATPSASLSCQDEGDLVKVGEEYLSTATASEDETGKSKKEVAVKPKIRTAERNLELNQHSPDAIEKLTDGAFSDCVIRCNHRAVKVSVRSSSVKRTENKAAMVHAGGRQEDVFDQSAMNKRVMALQVRGGSYSSNLAIIDQRRENWSASEEYAVKIADRWEFPLDKLEAFLLVKEAFKLGASLMWGDCHVYFNTHRELLVPRQRFSNVCSMSMPEQTDHLKDLKVALAKKWSRSDEIVERRKAQLKAAKLTSFQYQLLMHPLVYFDCYELEESESDSEVDEEITNFTYFSLVPTYIIAKIFRFLNTRELAALKCTCTDFHWLINYYDITGRDCMWNTGPEYRNDPCMHCGKIRDPRGDVSLCRRHTKMYYNYSHIGRRYWTCCNAVDRGTVGCQMGLHNNRWTTATFRPNVICRPWKSRAWFVTANHELWCDKEHL